MRHRRADQTRPETSPPQRPRDAPAHDPDDPDDPDDQRQQGGDWDLAPGREQAVVHGCRCPTLANTEELMRHRGMLIAPDCPLHRPPEEPGSVG